MSILSGGEFESLVMLVLLILTTGAAVILSLTDSRLAPEVETPPTDSHFLSGRRY
ncbi:hypothetical protein [Arboricoccus pini]|nr:hypothetical protein [Arboricoccus pini]